MLKILNPVPPPTADRAQAMLEDTATLLAGLTVLQDGITTSLSHPQETHSARVPERDVRDTLNRVHRMTNQAERELSDGRPMDALETLQAIYAILSHQLPVQIRAWRRAETDLPTRQVLDAWLEHLENLEATCLS